MNTFLTVNGFNIELKWRPEPQLRAFELIVDGRFIGRLRPADLKTVGDFMKNTANAVPSNPPNRQG